MKPSAVLITRPREEADAFAAEVEAMGARVVIEPLLSPENLDLDFGPRPDAVVATSPQAFKRIFPPDWSGCPVFVMGEASAGQARRAGFREIYAAPGDFTELCALISKMTGPESAILYLRGDVTRHDLPEALKHRKIIPQIAYRMHARDILPEVLASPGKIQIVTLFSPRSGEILNKLITQAGIASKMQEIKVLCLSNAVLESVKSLPWQEVKISARPDRQGMLGGLKDWIGDESADDGRPERHDR